jgi:hypothetical protein
VSGSFLHSPGRRAQDTVEGRRAKGWPGVMEHRTIGGSQGVEGLRHAAAEAKRPNSVRTATMGTRAVLRLSK